MTPTCPKCKHFIPNVDVNVVSDVAFCRACNLAHKLSLLVHGNQLDGIDLDHPPSGTWHQRNGFSAAIGATHCSLGTAIGALAVSLFWNGIVSIFVFIALNATLQHLHVAVPDWFPTPKMNGEAMSVGATIFLWIFLTPFIVIGAIMIGTFFSALFGRTEVQIRQTEGDIFVGIGPLGWRRRFNSEAIKDVRIENRKWSNGENKTQIVMEADDGKEIAFGWMLRKDRMKFIAAAMRKALKRKSS
jgi:hypothetical protein